jgi:hypothetical protein
MARPGETEMLLKEEAELRDLRPLFLPTERNAALPDPRLEPGRTFLDNETPAVSSPVAEVHIDRDLPPVVTIEGTPLEKARPVDALVPDSTDMTAFGFGRAPVALKPFSPRGGFIEVNAAGNGRRALAEELPLNAKPRVDTPWAPIAFLAVVDPAGLASPLVVVVGSRVEEVDVHFRIFLTRDYRIGERLEPGFYRIVVAP